jgi:hypothetical protein
MLKIDDSICYTIKDLMEGLFVSKSSVYDMMKSDLKYSRFGGKRVVLGADLSEYLKSNSQYEESLK